LNLDGLKALFGEAKLPKAPAWRLDCIEQI